MSPPTLRVMSFNARNSAAADGGNAWPHRRGLFLDAIAAFDPDLLGAQEVLADQHDDLTAALPGYALSGVARDDGRRAGEWALVAYRTRRFDLMRAGDFWLSPTPDVPSLGWDAACVRLCSWARLRDRAAGREMVFANTHWDHVGVVARREAAALLKRRLPALAAGPAVVLVGDLNATEDDDCVQALLRRAGPGQTDLADGYRQVHPRRQPDEATYHGFDGTTAGSRIDFVLHGPAFAATAATIDRHASAEGRYPSDHFAVTATLAWR